jgi:hypothetical protein
MDLVLPSTLSHNGSGLYGPAGSRKKQDSFCETVLNTFKEVLGIIQGILAWKTRHLSIKTYLFVLSAGVSVAAAGDP